MADRPRFFDDLAGVAGGAFSALAGVRDELESTVRARVDEAIRKFDLVKREDLEAVQEMAAASRMAQERAEARLVALEARVAAMGAPAPAATVPPVVPHSVVTEGTEAAPGLVPPTMTGHDTPPELMAD